MMETLAEPPRPPGIRPLPVLGGHLALDFANTVDDPLGPQRWDHVADYPALLHWAVGRGLAFPALRVVAEARPAEAGAWCAAPPRCATRSTTRSARSSTDVRWTRRGRACGRSPSTPSPACTWPSDLSSEWDGTALDAPLWPVADAAHRLLRSADDLPRLKRCAGCPWLFLDRSRNGSRRWCAMGDCGTHEKIRRYVSKRSQRRAV